LLPKWLMRRMQPRDELRPLSTVTRISLLSAQAIVNEESFEQTIMNVDIVQADYTMDCPPV